MKTVQWSVFALMVMAQLAVPFLMIGSRESVLTSGVVYKFRCGPVDPYDVFRGRYVALSFPDTQLENWKGPYLDGSERAYALLDVDGDGMARIADVTLTPPSSGDYLRVKAYGGGAGNEKLWVTLPFDRYYMEEYRAPAAEVAYRDQSRTEEGVHARIHVLNGEGVVEGLYFGEVTIEEYLRQETVPSE